MGNAQDKPPGSGGGGGRSQQAAAGNGTRSRVGTAAEKPQRAPGKGVANGSPRENSPAGGRGERSSPADDTSYLDAPAGALPPHLARLKNAGNHLFKHGQFGDALEKYTQAIDGCAEAGSSIFFSPGESPRCAASNPSKGASGDYKIYILCNSVLFNLTYTIQDLPPPVIT